jgi:hypothetical protein
MPATLEQPAAPAPAAGLPGRAKRPRRRGLGSVRGVPGIGALRPWPEVARLYSEMNPEARALKWSRCQQIGVAAERKLRAALAALGFDATGTAD